MERRAATRSGGVRLLAVLLLALSGSVLLGSPAQAARPEVVEDIRFDGEVVEDEFLTAACGFPVTVATTGRFRATVFFDRHGEFRVFAAHPSFKDTLTSPYASIETSDRGLDKVSVTPDGKVLVFGTGIHLRVKGVVYAIGLWRLSFDMDTGELVSQDYHGRFDVRQPEIVGAICRLLGPSSG